MVPPALASHYASDEVTLLGPRRAAVQVARAWPQPLTDSQQMSGQSALQSFSQFTASQQVRADASHTFLPTMSQ